LEMPSGKVSKQRRRAAQAPPPVRAKGAVRRRQASPRILIGAGAVVVAIVVAAGLAVVFTGGSSSSVKNVPAVGSLTGALPGAADVEALFKGVPQNGTTLGSPKAPVTMTEYIDLQCPYCQEFETQLFPDIVRSYVRSGKLRVTMRPWAFIGPDSRRGQSAVLAAAGRNKSFNLAEVLYDNQGTENTGWLDQAMVANAAASIPGLHVRTLLADLGSAQVKAQAQRVDVAATTDNIDQTPTIFVGKTGTHGREVQLASPTDKQALVHAIESALRSGYGSS
jgi:protein-disulfide isomerase